MNKPNSNLLVAVRKQREDIARFAELANKYGATRKGVELIFPTSDKANAFLNELKKAA